MLDNERKCAIYNRLSIENQKQLTKSREELINYCKNKLRIDNYTVFEDIDEGDGKGKALKNMMKRIKNDEFTDFLVYHPNRICRIYPTRFINQRQKRFDKIIMEISTHNVEIHSIKYM